MVGASCNAVAPGSLAGACAGGSDFGTIATGADTDACSTTTAADCAGSGNGCRRGTSGATGDCGKGVKLAAATAFGTSTCMAMAGRSSGTGVDTFGNASEVGDRIGRFPSACAGRIGSGWNGGGVGGKGVATCTASTGGSPAGSTGLGSGSGAGAGRLTGSGGATSGFGAGARDGLFRARTAGSGAGLARTALSVSTFELGSLRGAGAPRRPWWRGPGTLGGVPRTGGGAGGSGGSTRRTCNACSGGDVSVGSTAGPSTNPKRKNRCTSSAPAIASTRRRRSCGCDCARR